MKIAVGSDHAGFQLKEKIKSYLIKKGYDVIDVGTDCSEVSVDYPLFAHKAALLVSKQEVRFGILCCGTGEGIMMAANKIKGIRCGVGYSPEVSKLTREHNDANMIAFGARFMNENDVFSSIDLFLETPFLGGRHQKRVDEIECFKDE